MNKHIKATFKKLHFCLLLIVVLSGTVCGQFVKSRAAGKFKVSFRESTKYPKWQKIISDSGIFQGAAAELTDTFKLPHDVSIVFKQCGVDNAFYNSEKKTITLCYESFAREKRLYLKAGVERKGIDEVIMLANLFVLYHELGHALTDIYDLSITGNEEDAADQLATYLLILSDDGGADVSLVVAYTWLLNAAHDKEKGVEHNYADEHSLNEQRYYNITCWVYGSNEKKYASLVKEGTLPKERARQCPSQYQRLSTSWSKLLLPHIKK